MPVPSNKLTVPAIPMAGGTPPPTPPTPVPPPPQPPEYYTGYQTELQANAKNLYKSNQSVQSAMLKFNQVSQTGMKFANQNPILGYLAGVVQGILDPSTRMLSAEDYRRDLTSVQAEVNIATQKLQSDEWQAQVLHNLPAYLASRNYTVKSVDDVASLIPNANMTDIDRVWLDSTFQKMSYLSNKLPADFSGTVEEAQQKIVDTVLTTPKLATKAVHNLTVDELQRSFQSFATELPVGLTTKDVRDVLAQQNLEDDVLQRDLTTYLAGKANDWAKETDRLNLLRAGLLSPDATDLTPGEFAKLLLVQPMMAGVELVNKYSDMLPRPLAAWYYINAFKVTHTTPTDTVAKMGQAFDYYKSQGESDWTAYAKAWNEADMPWYDRLISEAFFDPTSYIGLGVATALARQAGTVLTRAGLKSVGSRIGPMVAALESGYVRGADAIFKGGMEVVISPFKGSNWLIETLRTGVPRTATYVIPKTLTQMSRNFARQASMNFKAVADQMFPAVKDMNGLTALDNRQVAEASIKAALERPTEGFDYQVRLGTNMLEFKYIDTEAAQKLFKGVVADASLETRDFGISELARLNNEVLNMMSGQPAKDTAGKILANLGIGTTNDSVNVLVKGLAAFKDDVAAKALNMFKSDNPKQQLIGMFDDLTSLRYENLQNPITSHMLQAGQAVSWVSRVSDKLLQLPIVINMERKVVMPFARWNLLFANFGPMNYLENMQRSFLGGGEIMYPKSYSGVAETNRLFKGLANAPYELQMAERGTARMEMALVDPKLGLTSAFRNGKIPFVTREVSVGGHVIQKKINIRGVDHKLTDMQSYNDMWEQMTTIQRAYDYQVHYMKALAEQSPDEMNMIVKAVDSRLQLLKDIKVLSKSDVQDIRRTVIGMGTVRPEEFNRMAVVDVLELERRQISKTLGPTFDAATDVRAQIKQSLRNEILDGSIFKDIDGRFAAHIAESRELDLVSLAKQIDSLKEEAANFTKAYTGTGTLLDELTQDIKLGTPVSVATPETGFRKVPINLNGEDIGSLLYRGQGFGANAELMVDELSITKAGVLNRRTLQDIDVLVNDLAKRDNFGKVTIVAKKEHQLFYQAGGYKKGAGPWYTKDVMQPVSHAPQNLDELLADMDNITAIQNAVDERIHDYRRLVELRSHNLKPGKEVDDFHVGSNRLLNDFMVQSKESIDQMVSQLQDFTKNMTATRNAKGQFIGKSKFATPEMVSRIEGVKSLPVETKQRLTELMSGIPGNVDPNIKRIIVTDKMITKFGHPGEGYSAQWVESERILRLRKNFTDSDFYHEVTHALNPGLDEKSAEALGEQWAKLPRQVAPKTWLSENQQAAVDGLSDIYKLENANVFNTRNRLAAVEKKISDTPSRNRDARFWQQQRAEKSLIWDEHTINSRRLRNIRLDASRQFLTANGKAPFVPRSIPPVTDKLTPSHIAFLYGVTGDDTYRGLTRMHNQVTVRPREDWIDYTKNQANAYAQQFGKTANDIGFTDQAIGDVYDQMWRNVGIDPTVLTPDTPTVMQLNSIKDELVRLHATTKLSESDYAKWKQFHNGIAEDLRQTPMYNPENIELSPEPGMFNYIGGKSDLATQILPEIGYVKGNFIDPFFGSGAIPISMRKSNAVGGKIIAQEADDNLLNLYKVARETPDEFIDAVKKLYGGEGGAISRAKANEIKATFNTGTGTPIERAAMYTVLQKHAVMGRINYNNEGNISSGMREILPGHFTGAYTTAFDNKLRESISYAKSIEVNKATKNSYVDYIRKAGKGDVLYLDPPYTARQFEYGGEKVVGKWTDTDRDIMLREAKAASDRGARVVLSESTAAKDIIEKYGFATKNIVAPKARLGVGKDTVANREILASSGADAQPMTAHVSINDWYGKKELAVMESRKQHELAYPTYDDANVIDETMRAIFPFWTYELFRTRWIPRTFMRTPGTFTALARFMDYSEGGYLPIPGTDLQVNPLRGTIWAGGLRRLYTKDFPQYNDAFPGANLIDQIGRAGFYPGMNIMAPIAIFGQATGKPEWGDLVPTFAQTGLSALRAISPEHIGRVLDIVYPDRFRDYQTMLTLGEEGYDASAIWSKKQQGQKITPEEEKLWLQAENRANGLKGILMQQTGLLRLRPQEYDQVQKSMRLAIEQATGVPVKTQIQIDRNAPVTGKRFSDLYKLDVLQTKMLYQNESYKKWQGVATSLLPSGWQGMEVKIADYYDALEKNSTDARLNGVYQDGKLVQPSMADVNQQLVDGQISPSQWKTMRGNIQAAVVASNRAVGESPAYKDVPKTLDERVAWLATKGVPTPTYGPDQELLWYYYQLRPEYSINPDTGLNELDFDTYYAKVDMLLNSLAPEYKQRLLDRIQADWTPMERLYSNVSREYFAGYRNIRSIVLKEYTPEQQQAINRAIVARGDELSALQEIPGPDGNTLVAGFSKRVRDARKSLRGVDPTLDAWSYFFGNTDSLVTSEAQTIYGSLATQYLNDSMVR